jgi:hypothetical protein
MGGFDKNLSLSSQLSVLFEFVDSSPCMRLAGKETT